MIRLEKVGRSFFVGGEEVHALSNISMDISPGEYLSIMGPSGSGKSTLLNIMGLLDRPSSGRYLLDELDVTDLSDDAQAAARREKIGFVFQFFHLISRLTAEENIALPMMLAGVSKDKRKERAQALLRDLGLNERARHKPDELSGGQRQRVAIARAAALNPSVLLADEPTGNLDRASGREVIARLEDLNAAGMTLILVTHDPEIGKRAKRRIRMTDGRIESEEK